MTSRRAQSCHDPSSTPVPLNHEPPLNPTTTSPETLSQDVVGASFGSNPDFNGPTSPVGKYFKKFAKMPVVFTMQLALSSYHPLPSPTHHRTSTLLLQPALPPCCSSPYPPPPQEKGRMKKEKGNETRCGIIASEAIGSPHSRSLHIAASVLPPIPRARQQRCQVRAMACT